MQQQQQQQQQQGNPFGWLRPPQFPPQFQPPQLPQFGPPKLPQIQFPNPFGPKRRMVEGQEYLIDRKLGAGASSTAYLGRSASNPNSEPVVIKDYHQTNPKAQAAFHQENSALHEFGQLKGSAVDPRTGRMTNIQAYVPGQNMEKAVQQAAAYNPDALPRMRRELEQAVDDFHRNAIHGDMTVQNAVYQPSGRVKFIDYENTRPMKHVPRRDRRNMMQNDRTNALGSFDSVAYSSGRSAGGMGY